MSGTGSTLAAVDGGPRAPWLVRYNLILPAEDKQETHTQNACITMVGCWVAWDWQFSKRLKSLTTNFTLGEMLQVHL